MHAKKRKKFKKKKKKKQLVVYCFVSCPSTGKMEEDGTEGFKGIDLTCIYLRNTSRNLCLAPPALKF